MAMWCLSGMVMVVSGYPSLAEAERAAALAPIDWQACCALPEAAEAARTPVVSARLRMLAGAPTLELRTGAEDSPRLHDLKAGRTISRIDAALARATAADAGRRLGLGPPSSIRPIVRDQWTVAGEFNADRPLWRVAFSDPRRTELYLSSRTGALVQKTTVGQRFWGWLGATPHWLYFTGLRQHVGTWNAVVVWTSLVGCFLAATGLYVGVASLGRGGRLSPYRGVHLWHHLIGAVFGVLLLTWVASGLVSMNPWGFLDSGRLDIAAARAQIEGPPQTWGQARVGLQRLAVLQPAAVDVRTAPFDGKLYFLAQDSEGGVRRLDAQGLADPLTPEDLAKAGPRLAGASPVISQGLIAQSDAYYFSHHETVRLPAWRVVVGDAQKTRYYLDPSSGALVFAADADVRGYRWLHEAPHRWDFIPGLRRGPAWAVLVLTLMAGVSAAALTGVWLSFKAVARDLRRLKSRRRH
jgi:hypothetical protein